MRGLNSAAVRPSAPVVPSVIAPVLAPVVIPPRLDLQALPNRLLKHIFSHLDETALVFVGLVCRRWRRIGADLLKKFVPAMTAHGSMAGPLKTPLLQYITDAKHLNLAVDQFPYPAKDFDESLLAHIIKNNIKIDLSLGTRDDRTMEALVQARQNARVISTFHKMHDKIWVIDHEGVIVGSPNVSYAALEGGNIESFIHIRSKRIGAIFAKYIAWLGNRTNRALEQTVKDEMARYNRHPHQLRLALAPIVTITDFVVKELEDAVKIVIRQFLISPKERPGAGADILGVLCAMASEGVDIEIYLDDGAYHSPATGKFVKKAVMMLLEAGCKVYTQTPVLVVDTGRERIQHDKLILAELRSGVMRTLIGSAGFTRDVICNTNAENFIATDSQAIYASMLAHHANTLVPERVRTTTWVLPEPEDNR